MKQLIFTLFAVCLTVCANAQVPIVTITSPSGGAQLTKGVTYQVNYTVTPYNIALGGWFFPGPVVDGISPNVNGITSTCANANIGAVNINGSNAYISFRPSDGNTAGGNNAAQTPNGNCTITVKGCTYQPFSTVVCGTSMINVQIGSPLAIELAAFNGKYENEKVTLTWATASEKANDRFEVSRSTNGVNFEKLGTVKAAGTTSAKTDYNFVDATVNAAGLVYYRLSNVDANGKVENSKVIAVYTGNSDKLEVSAVLSGDVYTVRTNSNDDNGLTVRLSDIAGRVISEQKFASVEGANEYQVSAANLNSGIYFLTVSNKIQATTVKVIR